jgi:hypothetical protein
MPAKDVSESRPWRTIRETEGDLLIENTLVEKYKANREAAASAAGGDFDGAAQAIEKR